MRLRRSLGATVAASMVGDPDVLAYADAVVTNGGTVSTARYPILTAFVGADKAAGAWGLTDDLWPLWAENEIQALTSLKQRRLATAVNSPTFTADRGYEFNGTTQYIDTGFIPSTHAVAMTATSVRVAVYERANVAGNTYAAGVANTSNRRLSVIPRTAAGTSAQGEANSAIGTFTLPAADSRGYTPIARNGGTAADCVAYKNGVAMTRTADPAAFGATLPVSSLYIGGINSAGTLGSARASSIGFVSCGAALSAAQELAHYNAVQAFATAVEANV